MPDQFTRREAMTAAAGTLAAAAPLTFSPSPAGAAPVKGRIKQSLVQWCYSMTGDQWDIEKLCQVAKELGCKSIELAPPETWATLKKHGLTNSLAPKRIRIARSMALPQRSSG